MDIQISFSKKEFNKKTEEFLCAKLEDSTDEHLIEYIRRLANSKKLMAKEAQELLIRLIQAIIVDDELDETMNNSKSDTEHETENEDNESENESEDDANNKTIIEPNNGTIPQTLANIGRTPKMKPVFNNDKAKGNLLKGKKKSDKVPNKKEPELCRYFNNGRCKHTDEECRFSHPKICRVFKQSGSADNNKKGCDDKCKYFHPNACRNSLKDKTCTYKDCKFFHLTGTKIVYKTKNQTQKDYKDKTKPTNKKFVKTVPNFVSNNKYAPLANNEDEETEAASSMKKEQIFREDPNKIGITLAAIMTRLTDMEIRQEAQNQQIKQAILQSQSQNQQLFVAYFGMLIKCISSLETSSC